MALKIRSALAAIGLVAVTLAGTTSGALADRNQYTRGRMMMHHNGHWHHGYYRHRMWHRHHGWHRGPRPM